MLSYSTHYIIAPPFCQGQANHPGRVFPSIAESAPSPGGTSIGFRFSQVVLSGNVAPTVTTRAPDRTGTRGGQGGRLLAYTRRMASVLSGTRRIRTKTVSRRLPRGLPRPDLRGLSAQPI